MCIILDSFKKFAFSSNLNFLLENSFKNVHFRNTNLNEFGIEEKTNYFHSNSENAKIEKNNHFLHSCRGTYEIGKCTVREQNEHATLGHARHARNVVSSTEGVVYSLNFTNACKLTLLRMLPPFCECIRTPFSILRNHSIFECSRTMEINLRFTFEFRSEFDQFALVFDSNRGRDSIDI